MAGGGGGVELAGGGGVELAGGGWGVAGVCVCGGGGGGERFHGAISAKGNVLA